MGNQEKVRKSHEPVMVGEVLKAFETDSFAHLKKICFVDATVGLGGHAKEFVKRNIFVIGIDADPGSLELAGEVLKKACPIPHHLNGAECFKLFHGNFSEIDTLIVKAYSGKVGGILFDLGISSRQLEDPERGFSFQDSQFPLDMRIDPSTQSVKASDLLAVLDGKKLKDLFSEVLLVNLAGIIAREIVEKRLQKPILTTGDFLEVIRPLIRKKGKIDSATLPFLALRMAVNSEKENLIKGLENAFEILSPKGRLTVISFHSGEDRVIKNFFRQMSSDARAVLITKKPAIPGQAEILKNPRSRSAKMRILEKI